MNTIESNQSISFNVNNNDRKSMVKVNQFVKGSTNNNNNNNNFGRSVSMVRDNISEVFQNDIDEEELQEEISIEKKDVQVKHKKKKDCHHKVKVKMQKYMTSIYITILILVLTIYSLFNQDFKILALTKNSDPTFLILNEILFCLCFILFMISLLFEDDYIGSFFFYLDMVELLSMIPDTDFIMRIFGLSSANAQAGMPQTAQSVAQASSASQAGVKAAKYLKLIRILTFMKIIRLAKILEAAKELNKQTNAKKELNKDLNSPKKQKSTNLDQSASKSSNSKKPIASDNQSKIESSHKIKEKKVFVQPSLQYTNRVETLNDNSPIQSPLHNQSNIKLIPSKIDFKKSSEILVSGNNKNNNYLINNYNIKIFNMKDYENKKAKNLKEIKIEENQKLKINDDINNNNDLNFPDSKIQFPNMRDYLEQLELSNDLSTIQRKTPRDEVDQNTINNNFRHNTRLLNKLYPNNKVSSNIFENNFVNNDPYRSTWDFKLKKKQLKQDTKITKSFTISENYLEFKLNKEKVMDINTHIENIKNSIKVLPELTEEDELPMSTNQRLDDILNSSLTKKLVMLIMIILIVLPILDVDYIQGFTSADETTAYSYCATCLGKLIDISYNETQYVTSIGKVYFDCLELSDVGTYLNQDNTTTSPYLLSMNFSNYSPLLKLRDKYKEFPEILSNLPNLTYEHQDYNHFMSYKRYGQNYQIQTIYFSDSDYVSITYNTDFNQTLQSLLNVIKIVFIAILLLLGAHLLGKDIEMFVTHPLDKLTANLKHFVSYPDLMVDDTPVNADNLDIMAAYKRALTLIEGKNESPVRRQSTSKENKAKGAAIKKKKKTTTKKEEDFLIIKENIKKLIYLTTMSIGSQILEIIFKFNANEGISVNLKREGVKNNGVILTLKLQDLDEFCKHFKEKSITIINRVYQRFHTLGIIYQADIYHEKTSLIWKEERDIYNDKFKSYIFELAEIIKSEEDTKLKEEEKNETEEKFNFIKEDIVLVGLMCSKRILEEFYKHLPQTMMIFEHFGVKCNFILNYGEVLSGYHGEDLKVNELFTGKALLENENTIEKLNLIYKEPSLFVHNNFYQLLDFRILKQFFPCNIVKQKTLNKFEYSKIYKLHFIKPLFKHSDRDAKLDLRRSLITKERKEKLKYFLKIQDNTNNAKDNYLNESFVTPFSEGLNQKFINFYNALIKHKLKDCLIYLSEIKKDEDYINLKENSFKNYLEKVEIDINNKCNNSHWLDNIKESYFICIAK